MCTAACDYQQHLNLQNEGLLDEKPRNHDKMSSASSWISTGGLSDAWLSAGSFSATGGSRSDNSIVLNATGLHPNGHAYSMLFPLTCIHVFTQCGCTTFTRCNISDKDWLIIGYDKEITRYRLVDRIFLRSEGLPPSLPQTSSTC